MTWPRLRLGAMPCLCSSLLPLSFLAGSCLKRCNGLSGTVSLRLVLLAIPVLIGHTGLGHSIASVSFSIMTCLCRFAWMEGREPSMTRGASSHLYSLPPSASVVHGKVTRDTG